MARPRKYKPHHVAQALNDNRGKVALAAKSLNLAAKTVYDYLKNYEELQVIFDQWQEEMLDRTELELEMAVKERSPWAIMFTLSRAGKHRGWGPKQEVEVTKRDMVVEAQEVTYRDLTESAMPPPKQIEEPKNGSRP